MPKGVYDHSHLIRPVADRFWEKVDRRGPDECWPWKATAKHKFGYGAFRLEGRIVAASRAAWIITYGPVDDGVEILHRCDNPPCRTGGHGSRAPSATCPCCNPKHLFPGTQTDNLGEQSPHAKLTDRQAAAIRAEYVPKSTTAGSAALARKYGVSVTTICRIVRGERGVASAPAEAVA